MRIDLRAPFGIPLEIELTQDQISIPLRFLPKEYITGEIRECTEAGGAKRCSISYKEITHRGGYGIIQKVDRSSAQGIEHRCIKRANPAGLSLTAEAILQWIARRTLDSLGAPAAVPQVYDIYQYVNETRFTMEFIDGVSAVDSILTATDPNSRLLSILVQSALLLGVLEEHLNLDHRDLKADNLWVRKLPAPFDYTVTIGGTTWNFQDIYQVVLLDFGFACIGDCNGTAVVNLSDGVLPPLDPCPKEGRDLFQLLVSLWSLPAIRQSISPRLAEFIVQSLRYRGATYDKLVESAKGSRWSYLAVSDPKFQHPPLHPRNLLEKLRVLCPTLIRKPE